MSAPPPAPLPPARGVDLAARELVVGLAPPPGRRRRSDGPPGRIRFGASAVVLEHPTALTAPLRLGYGALALAAVDTATSGDGRFAILRRLGPSAIVPPSEGIEGWLWTRHAGSAIPSLAGAEAVPNAVLLLAKPIPSAQAAAHFAPAWVQALAARSPLREPSVAGLLVCVEDPAAAQAVFHRIGLDRPVTDREVPPALRRALHDDRPADPILRAAAADAARAATSVPPPRRR